MSDGHSLAAKGGEQSEHVPNDRSSRSDQPSRAIDPDRRRRRRGAPPSTVFCPVESRSLDPRTCARCDLCVAFPEDIEGNGAQLRCRIPRRTDPERAKSWFVGTEAVSTWLPAGVVAAPVLVCARFDAPTRAVGEALERNFVTAAVVIDERARPLGIVGQSELGTRGTAPVLMFADADVPKIEESAPLAEVISRMAYRRARRVILVRSDGGVGGLVSELDVLHWVAVGGSSW